MSTRRCLSCKQPITRDRTYCQRHEPSPEALDDPLDLTGPLLGLAAIDMLTDQAGQLPPTDVQAPEAPQVDIPDPTPDFGGFGGGESGGGGAGGEF